MFLIVEHRNHTLTYMAQAEHQLKETKGGGGDRELNPWELENPAVGEIMEGPKLALPLVAPHSSPDPYIKQLFTHENFGLDYWWLQIVKFFTRLH